MPRRARHWYRRLDPPIFDWAGPFCNRPVAMGHLAYAALGLSLGQPEALNPSPNAQALLGPKSSALNPKPQTL